MGSFDEEDWDTGRQREDRDFSEDVGETLERKSGEVSTSGINEALARLGGDQDNETTERVEEPIDLTEEVNYDNILQRAEYVFFVNSESHLARQIPSESGYLLSSDVEEDPESLANELVSFLEVGGDQLLLEYVQGENPDSEGNLEQYHLVEGGELSPLGDYVADQVFEYSED